MRKRPAVILAVIAPVVGLLALLGYGMTREPKYIPSPLIARPAPSFTLPLFDGSVLRLEDLRGKVVFLNFWATWCLPCREEAPILEAAWRQYKDQGVVFVGVNIQDDQSRARAFLEEFHITYPNGVDHGGKIAVDYGVWGLPETFFIDRDGRIMYKHIGAIGPELIARKLDEAFRGVASAREGKGEYQSIR
ncbi:MAG TPA: TlpA disulfide reductase family protein [Methylomirabilota bacterium]|nr:TlpA disulfide reductase family protein [Methylomirabilota bacterium]